MLLGDGVMPHIESPTHLGVSRNLRYSKLDVISTRVATVTRAFYTMMPFGLHCVNGIAPHASLKLVVAYIPLRLIYGPEALIINKTEMANLDRTYMRLLKSIISLREGSADEAVYILFGFMSVEAELHFIVMSLFWSITRLDEEATIPS